MIRSQKFLKHTFIGVMNKCYSIVVVASWDYQSVKASKILYFKFMCFKLYQVYLNDTVS